MCVCFPRQLGSEKEKQGILLQSASAGKRQEKLGKKNGVQFGAAIRGKYNVKPECEAQRARTHTCTVYIYIYIYIYMYMYCTCMCISRPIS